MIFSASNLDDDAKIVRMQQHRSLHHLHCADLDAFLELKN